MKRNNNCKLESSIPFTLTNKIASEMGTPTDNNWNQDGLWTDIGKNPRANGCEKNHIILFGNSSNPIIETLEVGFSPRTLIVEKAKRRESDPASSSSLKAERKSDRSSEFVRFIAIVL